MNDRHGKHQHSTANICEKLGYELLRHILSICEKRTLTEQSPNCRALAHAAMNVKYVIETFLLIVSSGDE